MRRLLFLAIAFVTLSLFALAQDAPKIEVFGGYQFLHVGSFDGEGDSAANTSGWAGSATFNVYKRIGLTTDFSGSYRSESIVNTQVSSVPAPAHIQIYTYTFGPVASLYSHGKVNLFAHALFGDAHVRPTGCVIFSGSPDECGSGSYNGLAMMFGGGMDVKSSDRFALRVVQFDWVRLPSQFDGGLNGNMRISTGFVFRF